MYIHMYTCIYSYVYTVQHIEMVSKDQHFVHASIQQHADILDSTWQFG